MPARTPPTRSGPIALYFSALTIVSGFADPGGLVSLPVLFTLKEELGQSPQAIAVFGAIVFVPACVGFAYGFLRDRWSPLGRGDRGYLLLAVPLFAACYATLAAGPVSYLKLLAVVVVASVLSELLDTVIEALMTTVAQRQLISGRLSALMEAMESVPRVGSMLAGGWMAAHLSIQASFAVAAGCSLGLLAFAWWRPNGVFADDGPPTDAGATGGPRGPRSWRYLARYRPYAPAVLVLALYNFSPGWSTPLFYYFVDEVNLDGSGFGAYKAANFAATAAASLLYGIACRRLPLRQLLVWAAVLNVFPALLLLIVGGKGSAVTAALGVGFVSGLGYIAFFDLLRRASPPGMVGLGTALGFSLFTLSGSAGDLFGAWLYERGGFVPALVIDAVATMAILPVIGRLPPSLAQSRDGGPEGRGLGAGYVRPEEACA